MTCNDENQKDSIIECNIKNYQLGKTIGEGTFGKVKEAIHIPTGEKVIFKIVLGGY